MIFASTPALNSNQPPPRSDWNGMGPVADENSVCGSPRNSVQKLGLIQAVTERGWALSSSDHVRADARGDRIGFAELHGHCLRRKS